MLKVAEILNPSFGKAFYRISSALHKYTEGRIEWCSPDVADLTLVHVVGGGEIASLEKYNNTVIMQHCLFTTSVPFDLWEKYWNKARLVISYQDFNEYTSKKINMFATPWGAEPDIFYNTNEKRDIKIFTTGHVAYTENIDNVFRACVKTNNILYHTGENFRWDANNYRHLVYMNDETYSYMLRKTEYVACLRSIEGFEMAGIEGAFCGARPLVLDLPSYQWYKKFGVFINPNEDIIDQVADIISKLSTPYSEEEAQYIKETFSWKGIVENIATQIENVS